MGTSKPLRIQVHTSLLFDVGEQLTKLGHTVIPLQSDADLILGPNCARFLPGMEKYLASFIKGAQKIKFPAKSTSKSSTRE